MFSIISHYKIFFVIAAILIASSLAAIFAWGLRLGIDFQGGTLTEIAFNAPVNPSDIRREISASGLREPIVQPVSDRQVIVKTEALDDEGFATFRQALRSKFGEFNELRYESIGPSVGRELVRKAYWQIVLVALGIVLYITYAFRKIGKFTKTVKLSSWHLGAAAIIALLHDIIIPLGVFAALGKFKNVEIDSLFITALLTILGFSIHDTIVVFDRIRENLQKYSYKSLSTLIDYSVNTTLARSINTSSTLIFVLIALLLFGGETIFYFVSALLIGVVAGTYSSIFIASPLLYFFSSKGSKTR